MGDKALGRAKPAAVSLLRGCPEIGPSEWAKRCCQAAARASEPMATAANPMISKSSLSARISLLPGCPDISPAEWADRCNLVHARNYSCTTQKPHGASKISLLRGCPDISPEEWAKRCSRAVDIAVGRVQLSDNGRAAPKRVLPLGMLYGPMFASSRVRPSFRVI